MTPKKALIIGGAVLAALLVVAVVAAGVGVGAIFYGISRSDAAEAARDFLRRNERLAADIGPVRDFGSFVTGSINRGVDDGAATLSLKVVGARRSVSATVRLRDEDERGWRVTGATYKNDAGRVVQLFDGDPTAAPRPGHGRGGKAGVESRRGGGEAEEEDGVVYDQ